MTSSPIILVATDGSELSEKSVLPVLRLAKPLGASVVFVRVTDPPKQSYVEGIPVPYPIEELERAVAAKVREQLGRLEALASEVQVSSSTLHLTDPHPWRGILDAAAKSKATMIAMTSHGRGSIGSLLLGSQTQQVLAHSTLPVIIYR